MMLLSAAAGWCVGAAPELRCEVPLTALRCSWPVADGGRGTPAPPSRPGRGAPRPDLRAPRDQTSGRPALGPGAVARGGRFARSGPLYSRGVWPSNPFDRSTLAPPVTRLT